MPEPKQITLEQFFEDVGSHYNHLVIAEKHYAEGNEKLYDNQGFYNGLKKGGFSGLGLEIPPEHQSAIDAYYNKNHDYFGLDSPDEIKAESLYSEFAGYNYTGRAYDHKDVAESLAKTIDHARGSEKNMRIIAMDDRSHVDHSAAERLANIKIEFAKKAMDEKGLTEDILRKDMGLEDVPDLSPYNLLVFSDEERFKYLSSEQINTMDDMGKQLGMAERVTQADPAWHNQLKENFPANERIVAVVGANHPWNVVSTPGIDEYLGGDKEVATIMLVKNKEELEQMVSKRQDYQHAGLQPPTDEPHAVLFTDTMTLQVGEKLDMPGYEAGNDIKLTNAPQAAPEMLIRSEPPTPVR